jgi:chemotaxis protein methyltransferase CheR
MTTVDTRIFKTGSALDFVHFSGVEARPRLPRPRHTPKLRPPVPHTADLPLTSAAPAQLDPFAAWLLTHAGLHANAYRSAPLNRRLPAVLRRLRMHSPEAARKLLRANPELLPAALDALLIGVSSFFRDTKVFDYMRESGLRSLLQSRRGVSVMSAGVSNGCELYSVAMLLAEAGVLERSTLLGVDCRTDAIKQASEGRFQGSELAEMQQCLREQYFRLEGTSYRARTFLRHAIQWRCADLMTYIPPASDLILFRNVAIYLEDGFAAPVWDRLCSALTTGGFLLTGKAEKPPPGLPLQCVSPSVYRKKDVAS